MLGLGFLLLAPPNLAGAGFLIIDSAGELQTMLRWV